MIKVKVNGRRVDIEEASGTGVVIMSELCCIVRAVCEGFADDEEDSEKFCSSMVMCVANALIHGESKNGGADLEDDENVDF